jgi:hypothetical protein
MTKIRIAGAIASKSGITLYLENGQPMELKKDSHRTNEIMQEIAKPLAKRQVVEIDLAKYSVHAMIERKTNGLVRFFRSKVDQVKDALFSGHSDGGFVYGDVPLKDGETIVAEVNGKRIPGMEKLERQIHHAAYTEDCKGFTLFMERLAAVIDDRGHSVQELLNFMQKADLPIADDGSIVAYKTLNYWRGDEPQKRTEDVFVDKHSKTVVQKLGSRVSMPMSKVDPSRRVECSTGLHIARRRYLRHYFGDVLTLVKVAPEDVIAVPNNDPDKMRAAAYHIVAVLPERISAIIRKDQPMTSDPEAAKILADIIAGDHVGVLEEVRIGEKKAEAESEYDKEIEVEQNEEAQPFLGAGDNGMAAALDDPEVQEDAGEVDIRELNRKVEEAVEERDAALRENEELKAKLAAAEKPKTKKKRTKPAANKTSKPKTKKAADPAPKVEKPLTDAQQRREDAYQAVIGGMSQREAAKQFKVCAKTLRKMVKERASKAAE